MNVWSVLLVAEIFLGLTVLDAGAVDLGSEGEVELVVVGRDDAELFLGFSGWCRRYLL